ncbi:hypothetical protein Ndes2526B_g00972 [Nannochloris sp. 'desiccata']|nr:hypothetical protein KSW81_002197 [Chlorella desiccata (nom. nud.)]
MAFSDSNNQLTPLTREIATLTATLQREKHRRAAIASHAKEVEHRADTAEMKLKQVQYANKKLEEELNSFKENEAENRACDEENAKLKAQVAQLRADLIENQARQQELLELQVDSINAPSAAAAPAAVPRPSPSLASTSNHDVDTAMKELSAIIPQYRASILALQGRIAVLNKQLEQLTAERDQLQRDASTWRDAAERNEACFAGVAAKLHTQEADSLASKTSSQQRTARLESEISLLQQQHATAKKELKEARYAAQQAQQAVDSQQKLLNTQSNTIARLETTVREQQEDIIAALDLVCHKTGGGNGVPLAGTSGTDMSKNIKKCDIDASLDFLDTIGAPGKPKQTARARASAGGGDVEDWTIPASTAGGGDIDGEDDLQTWLHNPSFDSMDAKNKANNGMKGNMKIQQQQQAPPSKTKSHNSAEMQDLAADISALRDALQRVL